MVQQNDNFRQGIRDGIPICLGYLSVSFAFGISAVGMAKITAINIASYSTGFTFVSTKAVLRMP